jgi:hypothetical protein
MRKHLASLLIVGFACVAPLSAAPSANETSSADADTTVAVHHVRVPASGRLDQVAMVLVGTALIGLAAVVRRAA